LCTYIGGGITVTLRTESNLIEYNVPEKDNDSMERLAALVIDEVTVEEVVLPRKARSTPRARPQAPTPMTVD